MPLTSRIRAGLTSALLIAALAIPTAAMASNMAADPPAADAVAASWAGKVVYVNGGTFGTDTYTGPGSGTSDDDLYLVGADGLARPIQLTTTSSTLRALPTVVGTELANIVNLRGSCGTAAANSTDAQIAAHPSNGEFYIVDHTVKVVLGNFQYNIAVYGQPADVVAKLPVGPRISRVGEVYKDITLDSCRAGTAMVGAAPSSVTPVAVGTAAPSTVPGCTPSIANRTNFGPMAGAVVAPEGYSFRDSMFVSPGRSGTIDDSLYLVDGMGVTHAISLVIGADLPNASAVNDIYQVIALCPANGSPLGSDLEGKFFIRGTQMYVAHVGFAYPVNVRTASDATLDAMPDGGVVTTYYTYIKAS